MDVISLSLAHLGLGMILAHALVGVREVGRGFFTLCGWTGVVLAAGGWLVARAAGDAAPATALAPRPATLVATEAAAAGGLSILLFAAAWVALRRRRRELSAPLHHAAGLTAALAVVLQGWHAAGTAPAGIVPLAGAADFLVSTALLGGVTVAMILGHWYLVQPGLSIVPLRRLSLAFVGLLALRVAMEAAMTWGALSRGGLSLQPPAGEVLAFPMLVLAQRVLFGLAGPVVLAPMILRTVAMSSTMSATGLLYVAVALVWVGEFLSKYMMMPLRLV